MFWYSTRVVVVVRCDVSVNMDCRDVVDSVYIVCIINFLVFYSIVIVYVPALMCWSPCAM